MKIFMCLCICSVFIISIIGCSKDESTSAPDNGGNNTSDSFTLPFEENFDDSEGEISARWFWVTNAALGGLMWELDSADKASGEKSIRTPQIYDGWMCAQSTQVCWNGQILMTAKPVDLTNNTYVQLTFMNKRTTTSLANAPGCWSDIVSDNEVAFCIYWGLDTNISTWTILHTFSGGVSQWSLETVSLNSLVGRKVYLGFRQKAHCTEQGNPCASWQVDEIIIMGN